MKLEWTKEEIEKLVYMTWRFCIEHDQEGHPDTDAWYEIHNKLHGELGIAAGLQPGQVLGEDTTDECEPIDGGGSR